MDARKNCRSPNNALSNLGFKAQGLCRVQVSGLLLQAPEIHKDNFQHSFVDTAECFLRTPKYTGVFLERC